MKALRDLVIDSTVCIKRKGTEHTHLVTPFFKAKKKRQQKNKERKKKTIVKTKINIKKAI